MRISLLAWLWLAWVGCTDWKELQDGGALSADQKCPSLPDLTPPAPKCSAAQGLSGDNLLCADFTSPQVLGELTTAGWHFTTGMTGNCAGWTVMNNSLQVTNYSALLGSCAFSMAPVLASDYGKYNSFTLSVVETVDINSAKQSASIYNGVVPGQNILWSQTGTYPQQTLTISLTKAALPGSGMYQPLFQISSLMGSSGNQGWLIESIALNASP
jgi:hypothetical protein